MWELLKLPDMPNKLEIFLKITDKSSAAAWMCDNTQQCYSHPKKQNKPESLQNLFF